MTNSRLVRGVYKGTTGSHPGPFNLADSQLRNVDTVHNGRWYNSHGEYLGWGDLSPDDIRRITDGLQEREILIVLGEYTRDHGPVDRSEVPGLPYIIRNCYFVFARGKSYWIDDREGAVRDFVQRGVTFETIGRHRFEELVAQANA